MIDLTKGYSASRVAEAFGVTNSVSTKILEAKDPTPKEFATKGGKLAETASPSSLRGLSNKAIPKVSEFQKAKLPNAKDEIKQETNPAAFAVKNLIKQPFERQGDLSLLAGETGRKFRTFA